MNKLKRTLAMVATLAISATAFVGCGDDKKKDTSATEATTAATEAAADTTAAEGGDTAATEAGDAAASAEFSYKGTLPTDGDKMTVLCWTGNDLDKMLPMWEEAKGIDAAKVNFVNFNVGGGDAAAKYDQYFQSGEDIDMLMVEADWALKYINDDTATTSLESLGFTDADFAGQYAYTQEIGRATDGANAGKLVGTSWQAAPGGWCYRTDLAETYLGVKTPDEMQAKVSDWNGFKATAAEVATASGNKTALTVSLGGIWQAFAANRTQPWVVDGKLSVDAQCDEFIALAKEMRDNKYVTDVTQWNDAWYAYGQTDDVMGYFVSTWGFGDSILTKAAGGEGGATFGKWNVCQGPAPFFWGGTWACASPKTDNADMVASFMHFFTVDGASMKDYAALSGDYVNNMTTMETIVNEGTTALGVLGGQNHYEVLHGAAQNIDLKGLITPYDADIKTEFINAVNAYCTGDVADAAACVEAFKNNVAEKVVDITVE